MESLAAGLSRAAHRSSKSADQIPNVDQFKAQLAHEDASLSDSATKKASPSSTPSWLSSARRKLTRPSPVIVRSGDDLLTPPTSVSATSSPSFPVPSSMRQDRASVPCGERIASSACAGPAGAGARPWTHHESSAISGDDGQRPGSLMHLPALPDSLKMPVDQQDVGRSPTPADSTHWSADVQQLIQETERAFQAVGNAIQQAQLTSWLLDATDSSSTPPPTPSRPPPPTSSDAGSPSPSASAQEHHRRVRVFEKKPPARRTSLSRSQRRRRGRKANQSQAKAISLTLAGSVGNALGQRFGRVVADEMLTPDQMEKLKRDREERRPSKDGRLSTDSILSAWTDQSDRSAGPFHLEDGITPPATVAATDVGNQSSPGSIRHECRAAEDVVAESEDDRSRQTPSPDSSPPTPPPKSAARRWARPSTTTRLSTIPEALTAKPDGGRRAGVEHDEIKAEDHEEVIYFESTPLSSANRAFRHGPIAFARPDTVRAAGYGQDRDETVDWSAFHMAILGGAGDLVTGMYEDDQNQMADEVAAWFETFGFETHGRLIAAGGNSGPDRRRCTTVSTLPRSSVTPDTDLPIPVHCEGRVRSRFRASNGASDAVRFYRSGWAARDRKLDRARPLVVGEEVSEGAAESTPMGCNLEHDLDEFLRWERQFAYGGVF
ncbi:hypothetical protein XA68_11950 [Ophiocordyceps unilateralis]|uniref:Uncharacterized protein n=1 Tax=Ophiocordyceps unilateralis TaxID=268505 RepID=A0A2A9PFS7_OPHUN|nr:hypothetical protein XA68_11950 [Ophiocordyceps unilateralis]